MKTSPSRLAIASAALAIVSITLAAPSAKAGHGDDLISLSHRLEDLASELRDEFRAHYSHTRGYRHLLSDAARIEAEAEHIHGLAHDCRASLRHIATDLAELDELAHHLHELVDITDRGRYGHVHGNTRHVHELMASLTRVIHAMEDEVADIRRHDFHDHDHRHGSGYGYRGEGARIESGGFRITFRR